MTERSWKISAVLTSIGLLIIFFSRSIGFGYLLGAVSAVILYKRNEKYWSGILDSGHAATGTGFFHFMINYAIMAGVLVLSALYPKYLNIFACAVGLMLIKITSVIDALLR
jgi:hypothetical protein